MRVLWISIMPLPQASNALGQRGTVLGGWMESAANELVKQPNLHLAIASTYGGKELLCRRVGEIDYYFLPCANPSVYDAGLHQYWKAIKQKFQPDLVHIHGTEFPLGLAYVDACGAENVVVSIQGLVSECAKHYHDGMTKWQIIKNVTLHDLAVGTILHRKRDFERRAVYEVSLLKQVNDVIGRTAWDKDRTGVINPERNYHFCNETLRTPFYSLLWKYADCRKHTLFAIGQGNYPLKGTHQLLKALPVIIKRFPDTQLRVAGSDIMPRDWKHRMAYSNYLNHLIKKNHLEGHVTFLGAIPAEQMCRELLSCNAYVLPSTIENSSNSLGEAQLAGVPCVAARVGGIPSLVLDKEHGRLYDFFDTEELADLICRTFEESSHFDNTTMRQMAKDRHDPEQNCAQLLKIYKEVANAE